MVAALTTFRGTKFVRVDFDPASAAQAMAELERSTSDMVGLDQNACVQLAARLATLRMQVTIGQRGPLALYDKSGKFAGICGTESSFEKMRAIARGYIEKGYSVVPMVGAEPLYDQAPNAGPVERWGPKLALAIDGSCRLIAKSPQAATAPPHAVPGALPLLAIAIIVGGVAVTVVATTAVWRYFSPELRAPIVATDAAAEAYAARLKALHDTGAMPPPSEIEKSSAKAVEELAKKSGKSDWLLAGGVAAGTIGGALLMNAIGSGGR